MIYHFRQNQAEKISSGLPELICDLSKKLQNEAKSSVNYHNIGIAQTGMELKLNFQSNLLFHMANSIGNYLSTAALSLAVLAMVIDRRKG